MRRRHPTRREMMAGVGAGAATLLLGGCGDPEVREVGERVRRSPIQLVVDEIPMAIEKDVLMHPSFRRRVVAAARGYLPRPADPLTTLGRRAREELARAGVH